MATCKFEEKNNHPNFRHNSFKCTKYGFNSGLKCTNLNQPNCYKEVESKNES